jgi:outer membrane protein OmpA-like peptidoglycan-associated protein
VATLPEPLTLTGVFDAGVTFMAAMSGAFKTIAPPEMPKIWVILGTIVASAAFLSAKLLLGLTDVPLSRNFWLLAAFFFVWPAVICLLVYVLMRGVRTITYEGETKLAGTETEYRPNVANNPENQNKARDDLLRDAAGDERQVWTAESLNRSRRRLGIWYTLFIALLASACYLGLEALNAPKAEPTYADKIAKLKDIHFERDRSDLSWDAAGILKADADILKETFKHLNKTTVLLEGYCDDNGSDEYNFVLGYKRAETVQQALIAAGIDKDKLKLSSRGRKAALCQPNDEPCHRKNRGAQLMVIEN